MAAASRSGASGASGGTASAPNNNMWLLPPAQSTLQTISQCILMDFQQLVHDMFTQSRNYIVDWCADVPLISRLLNVPDIDHFGSSYDIDETYIPLYQQEQYQKSPPSYVLPNVMNPQGICREIILTGHHAGDKSMHTIAVFAQTTGASFSKKTAATYADFFRRYGIERAVFGLSTAKGLTPGGSAELCGKAEFTTEWLNLQDTALDVLQHDRVPLHAYVVPRSEHEALLQKKQCRRPLTLHRKKNPYTPAVLGAQSTRDKVSRHFGLQAGDIIAYKRIGCGNGPDDKYRHVRDFTVEVNSAAAGDEKTAASAVKPGDDQQPQEAEEGMTLGEMLRSSGGKSSKKAIE